MLPVSLLLSGRVLGSFIAAGRSLKYRGPSVGKQAQIIPTHNSLSDQLVASTFVNVSSVARLKAGRYWILMIEIATPLSGDTVRSDP